MLVGHNTLRLMTMGMSDREPTASELGQMIDLLEQGLRAGALGLSSGPVHAAGLLRASPPRCTRSAAC